MRKLHIEENGMILDYTISDDGVLKFQHFSNRSLKKDNFHIQNEDGFLPLEIQVSGSDRPLERHGNKYIVTSPGYRMKYVSHSDMRNQYGRKLEITLADEETRIQAILHLQFFNGTKVIRIWNKVKNCGRELCILEYVSSFNYLGVDKEGIKMRDEKLELYVPHNSWQREMNWEKYSLAELGFSQTQPDAQQRSSKRITVTNVGNWSTKEHLPMGLLENTETKSILYWQIEHNGSWHWEIGDQSGHVYIQMSGPSERESHWYKQLKYNEEFETVPVSVGITEGSFDEAVQELTKYRRIIRRPNKDNQKLSVIFNDYMHCLWGSPSTEKELTLIQAARAAGCEYYVIDAGWYSAGSWWDNVGEWEESRERFPNGLIEVLDVVREAGMIPGLWLELEVMGINCPKVKEFEKECFFVRHGEKVYDRSRYQLDFRHPKVQKYATDIIESLVRVYGIGYIKMDYNIEPGIGTEINADSVGEGLLGHERAYLEWLDTIFERYPSLVIENCSSGGLRIDYAMLKRYSIQSTSDMEDYKMYATIAVNAASGLTPEQAAVWSYPLQHSQKEEIIFNMVNSMLLRVHQSGQLDKIPNEHFELVREGINYYKQIRHIIREGLPFWPFGFSRFKDTILSFGIVRKEEIIVALWRRGGEKSCIKLPLTKYKGRDIKFICAYPKEECVPFFWNSEEGILEVKLAEKYMARVFYCSIKTKG